MESISGSVKYFYEIKSTFHIPSIEFINSFNINRNIEKEELFYNKITEKIGKNYIIINEDINRNLKINRKFIISDLPLFNINGSSTIVFDSIKLLENSKEIHIISTFWSMIIYLLQKKYNIFQNTPIYFHNYVRNGYYSHLYSDSGWKVIN